MIRLYTLAMAASFAALTGIKHLRRIPCLPRPTRF